MVKFALGKMRIFFLIFLCRKYNLSSPYMITCIHAKPYFVMKITDLFAHMEFGNYSDMKKNHLLPQHPFPYMRTLNTNYLQMSLVLRMIFSSPGQSPRRAIVLPPASALAKC